MTWKSVLVYGLLGLLHTLGKNDIEPEINHFDESSVRLIKCREASTILTVGHALELQSNLD